MIDADYEYPYEAPDGWVREEELQEFLDVREWATELVHHMYITGDVDAMEAALEELLVPFKVRLPEEEPRVVSKQKSYFEHAVEMIYGLKK